MLNSGKPIERNSDPSNIANLFQKSDFEGICFHADLKEIIVIIYLIRLYCLL